MQRHSQPKKLDGRKKHNRYFPFLLIIDNFAATATLICYSVVKYTHTWNVQEGPSV
ncbi:hypothetical protein NTE_01691 [Candidatus Nitrososphaera evergladensis SR1]|jgi:hypothetical protein|uniref:Uncharacterized protein n=1 Tax=Candidatus Nitrososphaera evergladensis SR1 TaxID=1459636 RepID=A0A075MSI4_9ARCH|nr:hypothetical protein NTE_01691 [Candidatus Nitrososphaera evergladensis SR1]